MTNVARATDRVIEHLEYRVDHGKSVSFVAALVEARRALLGTEGCRSFNVTRGAADPSEYRVRVEWTSLEARDAFWGRAVPEALGLPEIDGIDVGARWIELPLELDHGAEPLDPLALRGAFAHYPTGVAVVTAMTPHGPAALVVTSFTSVSLHPALVSFCAAHTSTTWPVIAACGRCTVNILAASQRDLCRQLAARGADRFQGVEWTKAPSGAPILAGVVASFDCSMVEVRSVGDHDHVVLQVLTFETHPEIEPLVFHRSSYRSFGS